ncbi:Ldh family oxidoreductase [Roseobacter sp. HKCCD7870]|uniref:Ldh family oxidoreductase n=1 Tax=Roseobacter sp. HKCCD7870 TaxID=3120343 RepID=UPI0030EE401A
MTDLVVPPKELNDVIANCLRDAGLQSDMAEDTAKILTEADLLGHRTHGLAMVPTYLDCLGDGSMAKSGQPDVLNERGASALWDGHKIAGAWLVLRAIEEAENMALVYGTGTVVIRRSFHIGCLASYLEAVTRKGLVLLLQTSAPHAATVAPHGGKSAVLSPSPLAIGYPTDGEPVLIDISTSVTSNSFVRKHALEGKKLPSPWVIAPDGTATSDPSLSEIILPLGGLDAGHKGFGMGLMVEALTAGLSATGRAEVSPRMGGTVFVQVVDPSAFGGVYEFGTVMGHVTQMCRSADPIDQASPVRMPGQAALQRKSLHLKNGVTVDADLWSAVSQLSNSSKKS